MAVGVAMVVAVLVIKGVVGEAFQGEGMGYDILVGAKGGREQLVLNAVYHLSQPVENIPYSFYKEFLPGGEFGDSVARAVPMISLPTHFQSRRVNCDNRCPDGSNSVVLADLKDPGCVRHIWILDAAGPRLKGKFSLEIVIDGAKVPQVSAPVKAFFGIMNDQQDHFISNSAFAVLPNPEAKKWINNPGKGNPGFNSFLPIPFGESCRITLHNPPGGHGVGMVDWHKYEQGTPLTALRLHADYRHYKPSAPKGNYAELANIEGAGFIHGINLGYDQVDKSDLVFHTGGMSILIDGETNPHAIRGHNAEDDFGIAWGFNKVNIAWVGCPWYEFRSPKDQSGSYYRFFGPDPIVFRSSISFRTGSRGDNMESVIFSYQLPGSKAAKADLPAEWEVSQFFDTKMDWNVFKDMPYPQQIPKQATTIKTDYGWVDLHTPEFHTTENSTYIRTNLKSTTDKSATLRLAIPGWANVWVNGKKVKTLQFGYSLDIARIPVKLRKGNNDLLILTANPNHIAFMRHWMVNAAVLRQRVVSSLLRDDPDLLHKELEPSCDR